MRHFLFPGRHCFLFISSFHDKEVNMIEMNQAAGDRNVYRKPRPSYQIEIEKCPCKFVGYCNQIHGQNKETTWIGIADAH